MPAATRAAATASSPAARRTAAARSPSVFRRCMNIVRTIRSNVALELRPGRRRLERQPDDGGVDLRRRAKGARGQRQQARHVGLGRGEDRQHAVVLRPRRGREALGHLELQHHRRVHEVGRLARRRQQLEQDRRRDVVGKVAGDPKRARRTGTAPRSKSRKSPSTSRDVRGQLRPQLRRQIAVDLDRRDVRRRAAASRERQRRRGPDRSRGSARRGRGSIAATTLSAQAGARKCWPKRCLRRHAFSIDSPRQNFSSISSISSSLMPK